MSTPEKPSLIGRDDVLVRRLAEQLRKGGSYVGDFTDLKPTADRRGYSFEIDIHLNGSPTGHIARVIVELDRMEER